MDPNNDQTQGGEVDATEQPDTVVDQVGATTDPPADERDPDEVLREGMAKAMAEAVDPDAPAPRAEGQEPPPGPAQGEGDGKPPVADETPEAKAARESKEAVDKEITDLGIRNEKAQARFRELAARPSEAEIAPLREKAERADEWERQIAATGASPEQFGATVNYTALAVRANAGDIEAARMAYQATKSELEHWAKMLGLEAPGIDPLDAHPDLKDEVESGALPRARALEVAQARSAAKVTTAATERTTREQQERAAFEQAVTTAKAEVSAVGNALKAADPAGYEQKIVLLKPTIAIIRETMHPTMWAAAIKKAYAALPAIPAAPAAPAARPPVTSMPIRPTGSATNQKPAPKDPAEAFRMGVESVR